MKSKAQQPLTLRERQALDAMIALHRETGTQVGPKALGEKIGVSKVYALQLIRSLVRGGHVEAFPTDNGYSRYRPITGTNDQEIFAAAIRILIQRGKPDMADELRKLMEIATETSVSL